MCSPKCGQIFIQVDFALDPWQKLKISKSHCLAFTQIKPKAYKEGIFIYSKSLVLCKDVKISLGWWKISLPLGKDFKCLEEEYNLESKGIGSSLVSSFY